ncbi:hypothetical protein E2542_SST03428 [Spatholobus suberectus]|nr:hypothetical protein E2542_SST03428 [Spatholobus suberectus]
MQQRRARFETARRCYVFVIVGVSQRERGQFWNDTSTKAVTSNESDSFRRLWKATEVERYKFHAHSDSDSDSLVPLLRIRVCWVRGDTNRSSQYTTRRRFLNWNWIAQHSLQLQSSLFCDKL